MKIAAEIVNVYGGISIAGTTACIQLAEQIETGTLAVGLGQC